MVLRYFFSWCSSLERLAWGRTAFSEHTIANKVVFIVCFALLPSRTGGICLENLVESRIFPRLRNWRKEKNILSSV